MLFDRNIEPSCAYCLYGAYLGYNEIACSKRGIMTAIGSCGAFRYEPTKREPYIEPKLKDDKLTEEDFRLQ